MGGLSVGFGNCKYGAVIALIIRAIRAIAELRFEIRAIPWDIHLHDCLHYHHHDDHDDDDDDDDDHGGS